MQERAHISFCPITLQALNYLAKELCRQIAAYIPSRLTPFLLVWGGHKKGWGYFGPEAQKLLVTVRKFCKTACWGYYIKIAKQPKSPTKAAKPGEYK